MTADLSAHPHFQSWTNPASGVRSFLLDPVIAPIQQSFYYVNPSLTADESALWFHCAWPPARQKTLARVSLDPANPEVRHFPQAQFDTAQPLVAPDGGVWFGVGTSIHHLSATGTTTRVFTLPEDYTRGRHLRLLATHLSLSADGTRFLLDGEIGNHWFVGTADLRTGKFTLIQEFMARHNHGQFSPVDPDTFLIAQDQHRDPVTGIFLHHTLRTWVMNTAGTRYECVNPAHRCFPYHGACHEWWSADGWLCYIDYDQGVYEVNLQTGERNHLWKEPVCHAHCSRDRVHWCADESPYFWKEKPCKVLYFNRKTGKRVEIQSAMEAPCGGSSEARSLYHIDPHPQFSPRDTWIVHTATPDDRPTVALTPVSEME
ncbi:MAG: hypothetical protein JJU29_16880 [Verrucomicrobia bacterium]|nr:hypothetical protein [Verrucomicrobiota bacterium]MCH8512357.1 oligogalacturonate lyase family protein [Kiritimatiellia bacterium]